MRLLCSRCGVDTDSDVAVVVRGRPVPVILEVVCPACARERPPKGPGVP